VLEPGSVITPLLEVDGLEVRYTGKAGGTVHAVSDVSFTQAAGETLGVVGESGCGKSSLGRAILRLVPATARRLSFAGEDLLALGERAMRRRRRDMQLVFQDPFASLDPRFTIGRTLEEPLLVHRVGSRAERRERVAELLRQVGLSPDAIGRYPHEFSGGQRQRIAIARAIALRPKLVVADEPVSALDVSIQSQILNLLLDLRDALGLAYVFISHDLVVVRLVSHRIAVMYLGRIVELGPAESVFTQAAHPYTQALLSAIPRPEPGRARQRTRLAGEPPSPEQPPPGCPFHPRCPRAAAVCAVELPPLAPFPAADAAHTVRCHFPGPG
jgi:oligopeptide/dipeptide ABC transporter ATP-binding protein